MFKNNYLLFGSIVAIFIIAGFSYYNYQNINTITNRESKKNNILLRDKTTSAPSITPSTTSLTTTPSTSTTISPTTPPITPPTSGSDTAGESSDKVTFTTSKKCKLINGFCETFSVSCQNITKQGTVIVNDPSGTKKGTIFLMTGGGGGQPYHLVSTQQATTLKNLVNKGYRVVELAWANTNEGIIGYPTPVGAVNLMCAPTAVMQAFQTKFGTDGPVCAQGNSGGSMQIGYGLTFYNLGNLLDVAILTGGPPTASFTEGCNGISRSPYGFMPDKGLGPHFIDGVSGFGYNAPADQMYCNRAWKGEINIYDFPDIVAKFDAQSLTVNKGLSPNPAGTYSYPNTEVYFIESQDDQSNANNIGKLYYNLISAKAKSLTEVSGIGVSEGGHNVPETAGGAAKIEELFTNQCK